MEVRTRGSTNDAKGNGVWNNSGAARRIAVAAIIAGVDNRAASIQRVDPVQEYNLITPQTTAHEMLEVRKEGIDTGIAMDIENEVDVEGDFEPIASDVLRDDVAYALDPNARPRSPPSPTIAGVHVHEAHLASAETASLRISVETSVTTEIVPESKRPLPIAAAPAAAVDAMSLTASGIEGVGVGTEPVSAMQQSSAGGCYCAGGCNGGDNGGGGRSGSLKSEVEYEAEEGSSDSSSEGSRDSDNKKPKRARTTTRASREPSDSSGGDGGGEGVALRTRLPGELPPGGRTTRSQPGSDNNDSSRSSSSSSRSGSGQRRGGGRSNRSRRSGRDGAGTSSRSGGDAQL